jgi:hypothetical protein
MELNQNLSFEFSVEELESRLEMNMASSWRMEPGDLDNSEIY